MFRTPRLLVFALMLFNSSCALTTPPGAYPADRDTWAAMHFIGYETDASLDELSKSLPQLGRMGVNVVVLHVNYNFEFTSHPELRRGSAPITPAGAKRFSAACRKEGMRVVVLFQCLGHQSWEEETFPLLTAYPEFDLTPGAFPKNEGIYCREWDPTNPRVLAIVLPLIDEIVDAFKADGVHVGMDEVFLLGHEASANTKDKDPAAIYAGVVGELHDHIVGKRGLEMLMWGDRLIDAAVYDYGEWEADITGTAPAVDTVPNDIIICDWHYELRVDYPSVEMFLDKGFRVLPTSWKNVEASQALIRTSMAFNNPRILGHLFCNWSRYEDPTTYEPVVAGLKLMAGGSHTR